jgi:hypothetical protein
LWDGAVLHNYIFEDPYLQLPGEAGPEPGPYLERALECNVPAIGQVEGLVRVLAAETGWDKRQAVAHLLAGVNPLIGQLRMRQHTCIPRAELSVYPGLTTPADFTQTVMEVQAAWGATDRWLLELTETESAFLEAVQSFGPPPAKSGPGRGSGRWQYWRNMAASLGWVGEKGADNARKRWDRMVQKWPQVEDYVRTGDVGGIRNEESRQSQAPEQR